MMRNLAPGNRRYRITHRAVQRLREFVAVLDADDEVLRDRLDAEIARAEDAGKAVRTLDVMLGNAQVLVPLVELGELYAIIKEGTVVTVLPRAHGEELVQRGEALQRRVADGQAPAQPHQQDDPWGWRRREGLVGERTAPTVSDRRVPVANKPEIVIKPSRSVVLSREHVGRERSASGPTAQPEHAPSVVARPTPAPVPSRQPEQAPDTPKPKQPANPAHFEPHPRDAAPEHAPNVSQPAQLRDVALKQPLGPVTEVIERGLALGRRRAAACALAETIRCERSDAPLLPLWRNLAQAGLVEALTVGDFITALRRPPT